MNLNTSQDVIDYLVQAKLLHENDHPIVEQLTGGVSSSVWKIVAGDKRWVIKQALAKLKVKADWFSEVERIHREHEVMKSLDGIVEKNLIPEVLHVDYVNHIYMMNCAEENAPTWKDLLMQGEFNPRLAEAAGNLLKQIHSNSFKIDSKSKAEYQDQKYFIQLRVDPFHRYLIGKYPLMAANISELINEVTQKRICLVHGDFSPKNMLVESGNKIVLIDFEVAHWGNPVFDLAYCIGHLMLKGWHLKKEEKSYELIKAFVDAYENKVENFLPHLGLMLLARMDGKSPVNYIDDENLKQVIRKVAIHWIAKKFERKDALENIRLAFQNNSKIKLDE